MSKTTPNKSTKTADAMPADQYLSKRDLIKHLRISQANLNEMIRNGLPTAIQGNGGAPSYFDLDDVTQWIEEQEASASGSTKEQLAQARLKKLEIDTERSSIELRARRGELIEIAYATQALDDVLSRVRSQLLMIPSKAAGEVLGLQTIPEIISVLESFVHETLTELILDITGDKPKADQLTDEDE